MRVADSGGSNTCVRSEGVWEISVPSVQFCCKPKTAPKKKVFILKWQFLIFKSRLVVNFGVSLNPFDNLIKSYGSSLQGPLKPVVRHFAPDLQFISKEITRKL